MTRAATSTTASERIRSTAMSTVQGHPVPGSLTISSTSEGASFTPTMESTTMSTSAMPVGTSASGQRSGVRKR